MSPNVIIMAGGLGKRMESTLPKVLHKVLDKPMLVHVIETALTLKPDNIFVIVGKYLSIIGDTLNEYGVLKHVKFVHQEEALGTGHAIQCCREHIKDLNSKVLILSGDVPLIKENTLLQMVNKLDKARIMTTILEEPYGYGRIIETNGIFSKIVEQKDANEEELKCQKVNAGIYAFDSNILYKYLPYLSNDNAQKEYYLTDIVEIIKNNEHIDIELFNMSKEQQIELTGVNTKQQLEELNKMLRESK